MKRTTAKSDSNALVSEFLAKGGQITKYQPKKIKPTNRNVVVIEIEVDLLPLALRRLVGE